ncbi:hypothetical protein HYV86_00515 [Candidatus Woesearchaeota archaeon]|nr:hypothetical protein [Candidatus Woesearchaeota archaeon]
MKHITTLTTITALTFLASACTDSTTISPHPQVLDQGNQRPYVEDAWKGPLPYYIDMGKEGNPCSEPSVRCVDSGTLDFAILDAALDQNVLLQDAFIPQERDAGLVDVNSRDVNSRPDSTGIEECIEGQEVNSPAVNCALGIAINNERGYFVPGRIRAQYLLPLDLQDDIPAGSEYKTTTICEIEGPTAHEIEFRGRGYETTGQTIDLRDGALLAQLYHRFGAPAVLIRPTTEIEETICYPQSFVKIGECMIEVGHGAPRATTVGWGGDPLSSIVAVGPDRREWYEGRAPDLPFCYTTIQE